MLGGIQTSDGLEPILETFWLSSPNEAALWSCTTAKYGSAIVVNQLKTREYYFGVYFPLERSHTRLLKSLSI
jgi:hypothetical protein